jgi:hypothetical protein
VPVPILCNFTSSAHLEPRTAAWPGNVLAHLSATSGAAPSMQSEVYSCSDGLRWLCRGRSAAFNRGPRSPSAGGSSAHRAHCRGCGRELRCWAAPSAPVVMAACLCSQTASACTALWQHVACDSYCTHARNPFHLKTSPLLFMNILFIFICSLNFCIWQ